MKNVISAATLLATSLTTAAQEVRLQSALHKDGEKITVYREWPVRRLVDTFKLQQGAITFQLPDSGAAVYSVQLRKPYASATLFSGKVPVAVTIGKDSQTLVKGDAVLGKLIDFERSMKPVEAKWSRLGNEYGNTSDMEKKLALNEQIGRIAGEVQAKRLRFALDNAGNLAGAWSAYQYAFAWTDASLSRLIPSFRQQGWASATLSKLEQEEAQSAERNMTGKTAHAFALRSIEGAVVQLDSLTSRNKYVLLDVWASWCTPCRAGNRALAPHYPALKRKGIEIVSVSVDEKDELWRKAVAADKIPWPQLVAPQGMKSAIVEQYKVKSLPATFLINKEGTIIRQHVEISDLEKL